MSQSGNRLLLGRASVSYVTRGASIAAAGDIPRLRLPLVTRSSTLSSKTASSRVRAASRLGARRRRAGEGARAGRRRSPLPGTRRSLAPGPHRPERRRPARPGAARRAVSVDRPLQLRACVVLGAVARATPPRQPQRRRRPPERPGCACAATIVRGREGARTLPLGTRRPVNSAISTPAPIAAAGQRGRAAAVRRWSPGTPR